MSVRTAKKLGKAMESALKGEEGPGKAKRSFIGNRSRERIYVFLTYRPMSRQRVIAEAVGISGKTAAWHLTKLEEKEFIGCTGKSYYPTGFISHEDMGLAILFSKRGLKAVFSVVSRDPGVTQREVAEEIGLSPSQISALARLLEEHAAISRVQDGRATRLYPTKLLTEKITAYRKISSHFSDHVTRLLSHEGVRLEVKRKGEVFMAVVDEGGKKRTLSFNTNPFLTLVHEEISLPF